jgi:hypothetical protein
MKPLPFYKYNGARSLVLLHEVHMQSFLKTWQQAKQINLKLPETEDEDYLSLESLLFHVLRASRGYIVWICNKLNLPDPAIDPPPALDEIQIKAPGYVNYLIEKWSLPLVNVPEDLFGGTSYKSNWGDDFCLESMLEHAVLHPIRHQFQLENLIKKQVNN